MNPRAVDRHRRGLRYRFTVDDPVNYRQPWTAEMPLRATRGPIYEYACHEGNYAMPGILAGARELERQGRDPGAGPRDAAGAPAEEGGQ